MGPIQYLQGLAATKWASLQPETRSPKTEQDSRASSSSKATTATTTTKAAKACPGHSRPFKDRSRPEEDGHRTESPQHASGQARDLMQRGDQGAGRPPEQARPPSPVSLARPWRTDGSLEIYQLILLTW